jgi:hypothetical protein
MENAKMNAHAVFAPSAAHRWFACPGSIRLCADLEPTPSSVYAEEGTAAHRLIDMCVGIDADAEHFLGANIPVGTKHYKVDDEMAASVQIFLDLVRGYAEDGYELRSEVKLDLGHLWPGQYGTADAVLYHAENKDLVVVDFKYGRGVVVEPEENPQLLSYLSGAALLYHNQGVDMCSVHIVQPRVPGEQVKSWDLSVERLADFESEFRRAAEVASTADAVLVAGPHCQFCPAAGFCPELREQSFKIAMVEFGKDGETIELPAVEKLSPKKLGKIMQEIVLIEAWCTAVREHALASAMDGRTPDGFKLVEKRTNRRWIDEDKAAGALRSLYEIEDEVLFIKKLLSPAQAEKIIGKAGAKGIESLTTRPPGGATLAPLSDKRKILSPGDASVEFKE